MAAVRKKKPRLGLPILALMLAGLSAVLIFTREDDGQSDGESNNRPHLIEIAAEDINSIKVLRPQGGNISLQRDSFNPAETQWNLLEPVAAAAEQEKIDAFITMATKIVGIPLAIDDNYDPAEFGLDAASAITVKVAGKDPGTLDEVILGRVLPLDVGYVYAVKPGLTGKVYKTQKQILELLVEDANNFRGHSLVHQKPEDITEITISRLSSRDSIKLERQGQWWNIVEPVSMPGDEEKITELLKNLVDLKVDQFSNFSKNELTARTNGLVNIALKSGGVTERVELGKINGETRIAAGSSYDPALLYLDTTVMEKLPENGNALVHRGLLRFIPGEIQTVLIESDGTSTSLSHDDQGNWSLTAPLQAPAETAIVYRIFSVLARYRLPENTETVADSMISDGKAGDTIKITLTENDGKRHTISIKKPAAPGGKIFVTTDFLGSTVALDSSLLNGVPIQADDFLDKKIMHVDPLSITVININHSDGEKQRLEKLGKDWVFTDPERVAANSALVWGIVFGIEKGEYTRKLENIPANLPERRISVVLEGPEGNTSGSVEYFLPPEGETYSGQLNPGEILVTSNKINGYFVASAEIIKDLPKSYHEILYRE